ncbi:hypothetical protein HC891_23930 [Candidatus Gracilibacteria bacterium]|nr:hypothetical protein [Candidatus Gracilibacteria bacterium]
MTVAENIETRRELPKGWRWVKLGEIAEVVSGSTPSSSFSDYWDGNIIWITPTDLGKLKSKEIWDSERHITQAGYKNSRTELVPPGTVVMSSRDPIGHLGLAKVALCTNQLTVRGFTQVV